MNVDRCDEIADEDCIVDGCNREISEGGPLCAMHLAYRRRGFVRRALDWWSSLFE